MTFDACRTSELLVVDEDHSADSGGERGISCRAKGCPSSAREARV